MVFNFCISGCGEISHKKRNIPFEQKIFTDKEIEQKINNECDNIESITVNTYTKCRHNNGDTDEVWALYTVVCH